MHLIPMQFFLALPNMFKNPYSSHTGNKMTSCDRINKAAWKSCFERPRLLFKLFSSSKTSPTHLIFLGWFKINNFV